jgi:ribosomal protein L9
MLRTKSTPLLLSLLFCNIASNVGANSSSSSRNRHKLSTASFVPPASPTATHSQPLSWFVPQTTPQPPPTRAAAASPSRASTPVLGAALHAKKKGGGGGSGASSSSTTTTATKKIQVKLLKHVAGTGQAGDVILVTPAFYNNKLRPTKSAQLISNDEVQQELAARQQQQAAMQARAMAIKELLEIENSGSAPFLKLARKAGPGGQLFGGIGVKCLVQELQNRLEKDELLDDDLRDFLKSKGIKITTIVDAKSGEALSSDIKHTGDYSATIALTATGESAKFDISVTAEE